MEDTSSPFTAMSGASGDGGSRNFGDLQLVAVSSKTGAAAEAAPGGRDGAIVEYAKSGPVLREDEEDLEVKLRRIIENVPVRVSNTSESSAGSGSGDFHQVSLSFIFSCLLLSLVGTTSCWKAFKLHVSKQC